MGNGFKELAHLKTNPELFGEGWERVFGPKCDCHKYEEMVCEKCNKVIPHEKQTGYQVAEILPH